MICSGKVQGGVIVLQNGVALPEGTEVTVLPHGVVPGQPPSVWEKMVRLAQ